MSSPDLHTLYQRLRKAKKELSLLENSGILLQGAELDLEFCLVSTRRDILRSRIKDLGSLISIARQLTEEKELIIAARTINPEGLIHHLPPEMKSSKSSEDDINVFIQTRQKLYKKIEEALNKIQEEPMGGLRPGACQYEARKRILHARLELNKMPILRKKLYKMYFSLESRKEHAFIRGQLDEMTISKIESGIYSKKAS